ncbi:lysosomal acid lipase/cholesteryl ester hydrolase [Capsaspora owczarzaki ATCC 30864]|uniref:Lipase n=1 Tax=Capsaspora owczarzaki (strain ATCC 30864) TaxID=595528 RepID=A0A0D2X3D3_CAPO3|nr:lysosomal acid lipase/cholesteryl ester hydrolase [Capsaspora owczarzaki ATCC 30864]KJE94109.1 lysosomal acid lipase/cholesteryl ester hydrolase [Capsaspora owczarzaki ATCC 30864]|eukprot:XP_004347549.1 lysosomal acid lipase/cholesteryl ester hydrolase [Capsaspora owczarzaki ATCC 30864]
MSSMSLNRTCVPLRALALALALALSLVAAVALAADPDEHRPCPELITSKGYPLETHNVTTADGYILTCFRIPASRTGAKPTRGPVILAHGVMDSSNTWVMNNAEESLAFILADASFDVWLMNVRGNLYGLQNTHLSTNDAEFWDFTWDDMANYDVPAVVSYVLNSTNATKVGYVGHSQGTTQAMAALSLLHPELADKLSVFIALCPVAHIGHTTSLLLKGLAELHADQLVSLLGLKEFIPDTATLHKLLPAICIPVPSLCEDGIFLIAGFDQADYNVTRQPVYMAHFPSSTSTKNMIHWAQDVRTDKFQRYDYGTAAANRQHYGTDTPPQYNVTNIRAPMVVFAGGHDALADPTDVAQLMKELPANVPYVSVEAYGHLDFVWGEHANTTVYQQVIQYLLSPPRTSV